MFESIFIRFLQHKAMRLIFIKQFEQKNNVIRSDSLHWQIFLSFSFPESFTVEKEHEICSLNGCDGFWLIITGRVFESGGQDPSSIFQASNDFFGVNLYCLHSHFWKRKWPKQGAPAADLTAPLHIYASQHSLWLCWSWTFFDFFHPY